MKTTYLIATPDSHGNHAILARDDFSFRVSALSSYNANPTAWREVGRADSEGRLLDLSAPSAVYNALQAEYLTPGMTHTFDVTEAENEAVKLRDMLQRIVDDASLSTSDGDNLVKISLIEEAYNLLHPD